MREVSWSCALSVDVGGLASGPSLLRVKVSLYRELLLFSAGEMVKERKCRLGANTKPIRANHLVSSVSESGVNRRCSCRPLRVVKLCLRSVPGLPRCRQSGAHIPCATTSREILRAAETTWVKCYVQGARRLQYPDEKESIYKLLPASLCYSPSAHHYPRSQRLAREASCHYATI